MAARTQEVESDLEANPSPESLAKAAANGGVPKNFRQQADIEAFYRFVHENDLREDALKIMDEMRAMKKAAKAAKTRVKH